MMTSQEFNSLAAATASSSLCGCQPCEATIILFKTNLLHVKELKTVREHPDHTGCEAILNIHMDDSAQAKKGAKDLC